MKAIFLLFDSLNRHYLPPYGHPWVQAPNFTRLAGRCATFERSYVCSMPCMPARRDILTGRPNFLHRPWGPVEPWDDTFTERLHAAGVSTHLVTDHYHYFEDGGATYHNRYSTWQGFRGQEGDPWIGQVKEPAIPPNINPKGRRQDWVNRTFLREAKDWPQHQTFDAGLDFLERNAAEDRWFLQIETFDPHEPFHAPPAFRAQYAQADTLPLFDWPGYCEVTESPEEIERARHSYAAKVSFCDAQLGRVLDAMDRHDLWKDTLLVVGTDHGFLLGEHGRWAKNVPRMWEEISHTPFFVWDPRAPGAAGQRRHALVQPACDLAPTFLGCFGLPPGPFMTGRDLAPAVATDQPVHDLVLFGQYGLCLHATDGQRVYFRGLAAPDTPWHAYTWMPTHMRFFWSETELQECDGMEVLPFSRGIPVPRFRKPLGPGLALVQDECYDLSHDPGQAQPFQPDEIQRTRLIHGMERLLREAHAPAAQLARYGFPGG